MSCSGESFFGERRKCQYTARCRLSRSELESKMRGGKGVQVEGLEGGGEKGMYVGA